MSGTLLYPIYFSDTTLRDGEQMPGALLDPREKLQIALALAQVGVHNIEAGFPASSPAEQEAVKLVAGQVKGTVVSAFCRAKTSDIDAGLSALSGADKPAINIFLATSRIHLETKLGKSPGQILEMIDQAVRHARQRCDRVAFAAEDASRTELDFLCQAYRAAVSAGATTLGYPDTLGILTPEKVGRVIDELRARLPELKQVPLAVHFHNDLGLATANTLAAVSHGAQVVQCTVGGLGERAGNAPLEEVAMALKLNQDQYQREVTLDTSRLVPLGDLVSRLTGVPLAPNKAVVGRNIFATTAGVHQDGLLKNPQTYLPFPPEAVGAPGIDLRLGRHSGRAALGQRLRELGMELDEEALAAATAYAKAQDKTAWQDVDSLLKMAAQARNP